MTLRQTLILLLKPTRAAFRGGGGGGAFAPPLGTLLPPPRMIQLCVFMHMYMYIISPIFCLGCTRMCLRASISQKISGGACPQTPLLGGSIISQTVSPTTSLHLLIPLSCTGANVPGSPPQSKVAVCCGYIAAPLNLEKLVYVPPRYIFWMQPCLRILPQIRQHPTFP